MNVTDKTRAFVNRMTYINVGEVVHTLDAGKPVKATKTDAGWEFESEGWVHD